MTKVIHLASRSAGNRDAQRRAGAGEGRNTDDRYPPTPMLSVNPPPSPEVLQPACQAAIENALSMALYFIRQSHATPANLWAATARTNRAMTLLKQASEAAATVPGRV